MGDSEVAIVILDSDAEDALSSQFEDRQKEREELLSGVAAAEAAAASAEAAAASAQEAATVAFEELEEVRQYADSHEGCDFDFKVSDAVAMEHASLDAAAAMHQPLLKLGAAGP